MSASTLPVGRRYRGEDDYWRLRAFLRRVYLLEGRHERSWHVARFDYARWHSCLNGAGVGLDEVAWLWEADGEVVGLVMPDGGRGEAHLSVDPGARTPALERAMLDVAEAELTGATPEGARRLVVWAMEDDPLRPALLAERGYERRPWVDHKWRGDLTRALPEPEVAPGYAVRALGDGLELLERCYASGLGFHEGDTAVALANRADPSWYRNIQNAPLYRRDLDLVAVAPDGAIAAFCTLWFDDVTRSVYVEPVATVPAHRRRGLARALLFEGLRRAQRLGATLATVGGFSEAANGLYRSVMGDDHDRLVPWERTWG
jgi:GNAT superfamily N-acetyltransferase